MLDTTATTPSNTRSPRMPARRLAKLMGLRVMMGGLSYLSPDRAATNLARLFLTPPRIGIKDWQTAVMARARYMRLRFGTTGFLSVYSWMPPNTVTNPPTVLLVHGFGGRASQLSGIAAALVASGFRVVAFDAPAHGKSDGRRSGMPDFVAAIEAVAAEIGPLHGLVAHSMGAAAAVAAMRDGLDTKRAVMIAPPADPGRYLAETARLLGASDRVTGRAQAQIEAHYGVEFDDFRVPLNATTLTQPGLIVHDFTDRRVPVEEGKQIAMAWRTAQIKITENLGHIRILRDPDTTAAVQHFLMADLNSPKLRIRRQRQSHPVRPPQTPACTAQSQRPAP